MSQPRTFIANWGPAILWAAIIFYFSTESFSSSQTSQLFGPVLGLFFPGISPRQFEIFHLAIRKLGHWTEYFILALLVFRAFRCEFHSYSWVRHAAFTAIIIFLYAISDELHQAFVPSRTASFADVLLDSFGGLSAIGWLAVVAKRTKKT
jgi:VanZ family protein